jgi:asparagine synthase (glutamine-hydrolysing)
MEGIAGTYGSEDRPLVKRMLNELRHRGPDGSRTVSHDRAVLGANILSAGAQRGSAPIAESDGVAVASDSCIFNRDFLKEEFMDDVEGEVSDPELILSMYEQMGTDLFGYLDGSYAISIVDDGKTILARDRYGLKPLYLSGGVRKGVYSSEIKSQILADGEFVQFPNGKYLVRNKGFFAIRQKKAGQRITKRRSQAKTLRELIVSGVQSCSEGDERLNILLSGGIDSSVVASAASLVSDDIKSVCVGVEGGADLDMARAVADELETDHVEFTYDVDQMLEILDNVTYAAETFDYPLIRSCIPNYMATHMFEDRSRITLCGEGGDEIFAGYDYMRDIKGEEKLRQERMKLLRTGYNTGFQRVDRMTASASLDGRMPLMTRAVIEYGLSANRRALIGPKLEQSKLLLRRSFEDLLPNKVMKRKKQRFSDGAGSIHALVEISESIITDREFEREQKKLPRNRIRTKEELLYYRSFREHFGDSESVLNAVGFTPRP